MRGARVKQLRREFVQAHGRSPRKASWSESKEKKAKLRTKILRWFQVTVVDRDEFRQVKRAWKRRKR